MIKRKLVGVYGPNLKCTKPADCLTDRSANQTHPTRELLILLSSPMKSFLFSGNRVNIPAAYSRYSTGPN